MQLNVPLPVFATWISFFAWCNRAENNAFLVFESLGQGQGQGQGHVLISIPPKGGIFSKSRGEQIRVCFVAKFLEICAVRVSLTIVDSGS
ncbi:MAG: hypothetical protein JXA30_03440 [Deltaproteobacteria bacterium]|nr:hypothetical protein [Deltaproteobacteria bacterium]